MLLRKYLVDGTVSIALHGYSHRNNSKDATNPSELVGLSKNEQYRLLRSARLRLGAAIGAPVQVFVPPYNSYNSNTVDALVLSGFAVLSAGRSGPSDSSDILFVPGTVYPQNLRSTISRIQKRDRVEGDVVVVMHTYDFLESKEELPRFRKYGPSPRQISIGQLREDIEWLRGQLGVDVVSFAEALGSGTDFSGTRLMQNQRLWASFITRHVLLPRASSLYPAPGIYISRRDAAALYQRQIWTAFGMYAGLFLVGIALSALLQRAGRRFGIWPVRSVNIGIAVIVLVTAVHISLAGLYMKSAILLSSAAGWGVGSMLTRRSREFPHTLRV